MNKENVHVGVAFLEPKSCPNKCGQIVLAREFQSHVENVCPMRQVLCLEGCGNVILGQDMRSHSKICTMVVLCERAEVAIRERALKELKLVMAELYVERERAAARHISNDGELFKRGWPTSKVASSVSKIEAKMKELVLGCRRKAKDRLALALSISADQGQGAPEKKKGPPSVFKKAEEEKIRGVRPWDIEAHGLEGLLQGLEDASICGGIEEQRFRCEAEVLSILKRLLQAALGTGDSATLEEVRDTGSESLKAIEMSYVGEIHALLNEVKNALHIAALAEVPSEETNIEFFEAVKKGDTEVCTWVFDRERVNPSAVDPRTSFPMIMISARAGDLETCNLLLSRRADVNARCEIDGFSALHWSAHMRCERVTDALLAGGANPRIKDKKGQTPLMKLVRRDLNAPAAGCSWSWEVQPCRRLPGPEIDGSGFMELDDAKVAAEAIPHCVGFTFRSAGIGNAPSGHFYVSLHGASSSAASPRKANAKKKAAVPAAVAEKKKEKMEAKEEEEGEEEEDEALFTTYLRIGTSPAHDVISMLAAGADACAQDHNAMTTLHHHLMSAPSRGSYEVVSALLRAQADVNAMDTTARSTTPLLLVVGSRRADLLRLMLTDAWPPADIDSRTSDGLSALALAEEKGAREVIELLKDAGASVWSNADVCIGTEQHSSFFCDTRRPVGQEA